MIWVNMTDHIPDFYLLHLCQCPQVNRIPPESILLSCEPISTRSFYTCCSHRLIRSWNLILPPPSRSNLEESSPICHVGHKRLKKKKTRVTFQNHGRGLLYSPSGASDPIPRYRTFQTWWWGGDGDHLKSHIAP